MYFYLSQNINRKIQSAGFINQFIEKKADFALLIKMLPSLAFVSECQVIHYIILLMEVFTEYFEVTYIGRLLPNHTRKTPPFRIWNLYTRVNFEVTRTNNSVEGWQNGFISFHYLLVAIFEFLCNYSGLLRVENIYLILLKCGHYLFHRLYIYIL